MISPDSENIGSAALDGTMTDQAASITVSRAEWEKLMKMLETLTTSQAELSRNQAELVQQLSRANTRVQELEVALSKANKSDTSSSPPVSQPYVARGDGASRTVGAFTYTVKQSQEASPKPVSVVTAQPVVETKEPRKTWAQIAAAPKPQMSDLSGTTQEKMRQALALLDLCPTEPKPVALYFRNIKRARIGQVRKALRQIFNHPWAVLGLSFIGNSVLEIVCHKGLTDQIIAKLRIIGATHLKKFDIFGNNMKKSISGKSNNIELRNLERAHARLERLVKTCTQPAAKTWYAAKYKSAEELLAARYSVAHDDETSVSSDSGYTSSETQDVPQPDVEMTLHKSNDEDGDEGNPEDVITPVVSETPRKSTEEQMACDSPPSN